MGYAGLEMGDDKCPSRALLRRGRQEGALFLKTQAERNEETERVWGVLLLGWPWAYEKARPKSYSCKKGFTKMSSD